MRRAQILHITLGAVGEDIALAQGPGGVHMVPDLHPHLAVPESVAGHARGGAGVEKVDAGPLATASNVAPLDAARGAANKDDTSSTLAA